MARNLAGLVKRLAMPRMKFEGGGEQAMVGLSPDEIRRLTLRDLRRFYAKEVIMPKVKRREGG